VLVQPDGKIVVAGYGEVAGQLFAVARYDSVGLLDPAFGTGGTVLTPIPGSSSAFANGAVLLSDGRIVLAGHNSTDFALARYATNGALDPTVGVNGTSTITHGASNGVATALARQPNGKLVAAGYVLNGDDVLDFHSNDFDFGVRRYDAEGAPDLTFGTGGLVVTSLGPLEDTAEDLALQPDGKIVVVGGHWKPGFDLDAAVVRFDTDGTPDAGFGLGGMVVMDLGSFADLAQAVAIQPDGKIIVAGGIDYDVMVMRLDGTGALDPTFGTGGITTVALASAYATDVVLAPDGGLARGRSFQTTACWWLSIVVLGGLGLNALFGRWWADPLAALGIVYFLVREGRDAWNADRCCA
jgi:uncharacterized delta-60 repeat protein